MEKCLAIVREVQVAAAATAKVTKIVVKYGYSKEVTTSAGNQISPSVLSQP
jgi:hypothetical protein